MIESEENINSIFDHPESEIVKIRKEPQFDSKQALVLKNGQFFWAENGKVETEEDKKKKRQGMWNSKFSLKEHIKDEIWYPAFELRDISMSIRRGTLTSIIGKIGSGKSSLLQALLGEMPLYADDKELESTNMSLQINGSVSYLSQTPWLLKTTVEKNIIMGKKFDKKRLNEAIKYSALDIDLKTWDDGLQHKIGAKGALISGGQKARIALARCLYRDSDIYILDDIVSALDSGVAAFVMKQTIGKYLSGKTIILTTHNLTTLPYSDHIVYLENGRIIKQGKFENMQDNILWKKHTELMEENNKLLDMEEMGEDEEDLPTMENKLAKHVSVDMTKINAKGLRNEEKKDKKLTEQEELDARKEMLKVVGRTAKWLNKHVGLIDWELIAYSLSFMGGFKTLIVTIILGSIQTMYSDYSSQYLSLWGEDFEAQTKFSYLVRYSLITLFSPILSQIVSWVESKKIDSSQGNIRRAIIYRLLHGKI